MSQMTMGDPPVFVYGPTYWALSDDGDPIRTDPAVVGSPRVRWTVFGFSTVEHEPPLHTSVMLIGLHVAPQDPVIREAQFQLYGAEQTVETADLGVETDSAGGVTIITTTELE